MKLILQKDVKNLGKAGDQVSVKNGFARNFLLPKGYALLLNKDRVKAWNHQKTIITAKKRKAVSERKALIEQLSLAKLVFEKESQKDNKIFGSVTAHEISQALEEKHKISVDKRDIHFSELKTVGDHKISIRLDSECQTEILLTIKGKIRKKRPALIKTTDQEMELISPKAETAALPETAEAKDTVSKEEPAVVALDKTDEKEDPEQKTEKIASSSEIKSEKPQEPVSIKAEHLATDKEAQLQNKFKKATADEVKTVKASSTASFAEDSKKAKGERQEESKASPARSQKAEGKTQEGFVEDSRKAKSKTQEGLVEDSGKAKGRKQEESPASSAKDSRKQEEAKKEQKAKKAEDTAKSLSQNKSEPNKESKKSGGFFKKLFGKK
ncbi:MAG: 50S ribosomal protein L9 [Oligoflexia bacterium]|nr:50S ribosomal protein L9 [Oligoflexia bacterium]